MFDTLMYAKRLEAGGMTRDQAEAQVNVIAEMVVDGVATKQDLALLKAENQKDLAELRLEMHTDFAAVRAEMAEGFAAVRAEMAQGFAAVRAEMAEGLAAVRAEMNEGFAAIRGEMADLKHDLMVKMGAMFVASTTITITVLALIK